MNNNRLNPKIKKLTEISRGKKNKQINIISLVQFIDTMNK